MNVELLRGRKGEISVYTECQLNYLTEIEQVLKKSIPYNDFGEDFDYEDEEEFIEIVKKVSAIEENFKTIIDSIKYGRSARRKFLQTYPKWIKIRKDGIGKLREIAQEIQTDRFNCNVSKLVGYCTSLVGGGITLTSAILIPFTFGLTTPLAIAGGSIMGAGCAASVGTSVTEAILLNKKINEAKGIIDEDKVHFQDMNGWMEHSSKLNKALCEIMEIDIVKDISESVKDLVKRGMKIKDEYTRLNNITKTFNTIISNLTKTAEVLAKRVIIIATIVFVLSAIWILLWNTENRLLFDCASFTVRSIFGVAALVDDVFDFASLSVLFSANTTVAKNVAKAATRGAVAVFGMALDVAGIVLTSIDIHKGSLSSEAEKINEAADELEKQSKTVENIYENMN